QPVVAPEAEEEVVARDARDLLRLEAEQLSDAVVLVDDEVAAPQIRERLERAPTNSPRSEEHTSELQSRFDLVCRLLLEKKTIKSPATDVLHRRPDPIACILGAVLMAVLPRVIAAAAVGVCNAYLSSPGMPSIPPRPLLD